MECVELKAGLWRAHVLPSFGADLINLSWNGQRILRCPPGRAQLEKAPHLYGSPFLMPPNRTGDGRFAFEGKAYELPVNEREKNNHIHGLLYNAPFTVTNRTECQLRCGYKNRGERYPFPFSVFFCYELWEDGLLVEVTVVNDGEGNMPLLIGFHTTFAEPETFAVPVGKRWERDERFLPTGRLLKLDEAEKRMRDGMAVDGRPLSGFYTAEGHRARIGDFVMETSENFSQWIVFNGGGGQGYLCVEPQSGPVNGLNMPEMCQVAGKGEEKRYWVRFHRG